MHHQIILFISCDYYRVHKTAVHLKLLLDQSRHNEKEIRSSGTIRVDGEHHRLGVERGGQIELNVAKSLQEELSDIRSNAHKRLDFFLRLACLPHLGSHSIHVLLNPGFEIIGSANLSLGVGERSDHIVHKLGARASRRTALLALLTAAGAEGLIK